MATRTYGQYCPVAHALDEIGDRWTLLIVRDLSFGPQRFTDLRQSLVGLAPNLLTDRLRGLEESGLVAREELPAPAARTVYVLTDEGRSTLPVLAALARFGANRLPAPGPKVNVKPRPALVAGLTAFHRADPSIDRAVVYRIDLDGEAFDIRAADGRIRRASTDAEPVLTVTTTARSLLDIRRGERTFTESVKRGDVTTTGTKTAVRQFCAQFALR